MNLSAEFQSTQPHTYSYLLRQEVSVVVVVAQLVEEGPRLEDEGGEDDAGEVHAGTDLLHQEPNNRFVLVAYLLRLKQQSTFIHRDF